MSCDLLNYKSALMVRFLIMLIDKLLHKKNLRRWLNVLMS